MLYIARSSAWKGALDIEISIQPIGDKIGIVQKKSKDSELTTDIFVELIPVILNGWIDEDGESVKSAVIIPSEEPVKRDAMKDTGIQSFRNAWSDSGQDIIEGHPYVSRSAWLRSMVTNDGTSEKTAQQNMRPSETNRIVGRLISTGVIMPHSNGFMVIDPGLCTQLLLSVQNVQ